MTGRRTTPGCLACTGWTNDYGKSPVHNAGCPRDCVARAGCTGDYHRAGCPTAGREAAKSTCLDCGRTFDAEGTADLHGMTKGHAITSGREASACATCRSHDHTTEQHVPFDAPAGRDATVPCTCGAHPWADPEDYDHGSSCPLSAGREATCDECGPLPEGEPLYEIMGEQFHAVMVREAKGWEAAADDLFAMPPSAARCSCGPHAIIEGTVPDPRCPFHGADRQSPPARKVT